MRPCQSCPRRSPNGSGLLGTDGHPVIIVPHQFLDEKRRNLPSRRSGNGRRFHATASLMAEIKTALAPNSYRLRHLIHNNRGYDYAIPPDRHADGCYEIELVIQKRAPPAWELEQPKLSSRVFRRERAALVRLLVWARRWLLLQIRAALRPITRRLG